MSDEGTDTITDDNIPDRPPFEGDPILTYFAMATATGDIANVGVSVVVDGSCRVFST